MSKASRSDTADGQADQVPPADEELLAAFVGGRTAALGELAGRYERRLLGLACGILGGQQDLACDAVQETWVRVLRFARSFRRESSFKTWIYRIAINQCRTMGQRGRVAGAAGAGGADGAGGGGVGWAEAAKEVDLAKNPASASAQPATAVGQPTTAATEPTTTVRAPVAGPVETAIDHELQDLLRQAVGELDDGPCEVVLLCYHAGLTHAEAAEILDIPVGTLKSRLHAALTALRARLGQYQQT